VRKEGAYPVRSFSVLSACGSYSQFSLRMPSCPKCHKVANPLKVLLIFPSRPYRCQRCGRSLTWDFTPRVEPRGFFLVPVLFVTGIWAAITDSWIQQVLAAGVLLAFIALMINWVGRLKPVGRSEATRMPFIHTVWMAIIFGAVGWEGSALLSSHCSPGRSLLVPEAVIDTRLPWMRARWHFMAWWESSARLV